MIDTTWKHSVFRMTKNLYETMVRFQIPIDDRIKIRFFRHFQEHLKEEQKSKKSNAQNKSAKAAAAQE